MMRPSRKQGHTYELPLPCTIYGLYKAVTGTLVLEHVWCDGENYGPAELTPDEYERFMYKLKQELLFESDF